MSGKMRSTAMRCCNSVVMLKLSLKFNATESVVPAKAGRSAKREERPKDGPAGVSEANHPVTLRIFKSLGPGLSQDDEHLGTSASR